MGIDATDRHAAGGPFYDGGTEEFLANGQLRWSFPARALVEYGRDVHGVQESIVQSEPNFDFAPWAKLARSAPECGARLDQDWLQRLSVEAQRLLEELDELQASQVRCALKIAAIISATTPSSFLLKKEVDARCCRWLRANAPSQPELLELGIRLWQWERKAGPLRRTKGIESFTKTMLELFVEAAERDPDHVAALVRQTCSNGHGVFWPDDIRETESHLALGRKLHRVFPKFSLDMLLSSLSDYRSPYFEKQGAPDVECRMIADEAFELMARLLPDNPNDRPWVYERLALFGYRDAPWYPQILEHLLTRAPAGRDQSETLRYTRCVALHAPLGHALSLAALEQFAELSSNIELLSCTNHPFSRCFGDVVEATALCTDQTCGDRNRDFPPLQEHPLRIIARKAYWACVDAVEHRQSAQSLELLSVIIQRGEEDDSLAAADRFALTFRSKATLDPARIAVCLEDLAESSHGRRQAPRQNRPQRCKSVCERVAPIFGHIAPNKMPAVLKAMAAPRRAYI